MGYEIESDFTKDPANMGWLQQGGSSIAWNTVDAIGGSIGAVPDMRYHKFLGKKYQPNEFISALFALEVGVVPIDNAIALLGFFDSQESSAEDLTLSIYIDGTRLHLYVAYDDASNKKSTDFITILDSKKYICAIRNVPEDGKAYLGLYDFLTQQLIQEISMDIDSTKNFDLNQVGLSEWNSTDNVYNVWAYEINAIGDPETIVYEDLYCTPEQARQMTNLDELNDMSDSTLASLETVFAMPQVDARFRAEGYGAPFKTGDDTPPLIRAITALLTSAYAARKSYIGHDPNDSPVYKDVLKEVNAIWKSLLNGELELLDIDGNWIERDQPTSTDMLSTTE
ncbi:MAG: hypothetical protein JRI42_06995, partial [Deltaproteobacteria bacterium]|nr:hypothetical protein [Deltaproteobacteria bacterium]